MRNRRKGSELGRIGRKGKEREGERDATTDMSVASSGEVPHHSRPCQFSGHSHMSTQTCCSSYSK